MFSNIEHVGTNEVMLRVVVGELKYAVFYFPAYLTAHFSAYFMAYFLDGLVLVQFRAKVLLSQRGDGYAGHCSRLS